MRETLPKPIHESYQRHRRQRTTQIILPMVLVVLLFLAIIIVLVNVTLLQNAGDLSRWAAVSTIWIVLPMIFAGLIFLALLVGMIYLLVRLLGITPVYTKKAQDFVWRLSDRIQRLADASVKPVIYLDGVGASIKALLGKKQ